MPLILLCGIPQSGKTQFALQLKQFLEQQQWEVVLINEESLSINKPEAYSSSFTEKNLRALIKSTVERELSQSKIIICDSLNYIKGYRYELHCIVKTVKTTHCVVYFEIPVDVALQRNQVYPPELLRDLANRMEVPQEKNRWDHPLIVIRENQEILFEDILNSLITTRQLPDPVATKGQKVQVPDYVYQVDRVTQNTIEFILNAQELYPEGSEIPVPDSALLYPYSHKLTSLQLRKARKQFLQMNKHSPGNLDNIQEAFLEYLRTSLSL